MKGRQGPSPLLSKCRSCGADLGLAKPVQVLFAICRRCESERPGADFGGGFVVSFGRKSGGERPMNHPNDGAYGLSD